MNDLLTKNNLFNKEDDKIDNKSYDDKTNESKEYQNYLIKSLSNKNIDADSFVEISLNDEHWLIDLSYIMESIMPPKISYMKKGPEWALGVFGYKGNVWEVVDMHVLLKNEKAFNPKMGWVTLLYCNKDKNVMEYSSGNKIKNIALFWSSIVEVKSKKEYDCLLNSNKSNKDNESVNVNAVFYKNIWKNKKTNKIIKEIDVDKIIGYEGLINLWSFSFKNNFTK